MLRNSKESVLHSLSFQRNENIENSSVLIENYDEANREKEAVTDIILSIIWQGNKLGAAYYDINTSQIHLMMDQPETANKFYFLKLLLRQTEPLYIVTSSRTDESVINVIKEFVSSSPSTNVPSNESSLESSSNERKIIHFLPSIDFAFEACKHRLENLNLSSIPKNMNENEKFIYISSLFDFKNTCMIKAAGGLLKFIDKNRISFKLDETESLVISAKMFSLKNIVSIDENTFNALQIFQEERHPSVYKSATGSKEGLSLYGVCNKCKSSIGSKELRSWFLAPTNDIKLIQHRQDAIKFFVSVQNTEVTKTLQGCLKNIKYIPKILSRMKTAQASINDWQNLNKTAYNALVIKDICRPLSSRIEIFKEINEAFSNDLFSITSFINKIIDFPESLKQNHFVVKQGIDSELDQMKRTYNGLPDFMTKVAQQELHHLSEDIQECSVIYLPQLGYLLTIPLTEEMKKSKDYKRENLDFMFVSNNFVHYKSTFTKELDNLLGDTLCEIIDKETQIMHSLQNIILEMSHVLNAVMEYAAKLDCLIALSVVCKEYQWVQPEMSLDGHLSIRKGRHPLQEMCVASYIPNDAYSGSPECKIKILSGANNCGKSVYLKQVALIVYLGHLGSFVPAEHAEIPLIDGIFSCMHVVESVSLNHSSFLIMLNQFASALNYATENSLVIIDEFAKSTDPKCALALLIASIKYWLEKGNASPHIFIATHILPLYKYLPDCPQIKYQTMDIIKNEELVYLYQLIEGRSDSSYAFQTALQAGLPKQMVERSYKILETLKEKQAVPVLEPNIIMEKKKRYNLIFEEFLKLDTSSCEASKFLDYVNEINISNNTPHSKPSSEIEPHSTFSSI